MAPDSNDRGRHMGPFQPISSRSFGLLDIKDGELGKKIIKVITTLALGQHGPRYKPGGARELVLGIH